MWRGLSVLSSLGLFTYAPAMMLPQDKTGKVSYPANNPIEDRFVSKKLKSFNARCSAVFDGHGGWQISDFLYHNIIQTIEDNYKLVKSDPKKSVHTILEKSFDSLEERIVNAARDSYKMGFANVASTGSCAIVAIVFEDLYAVANAGDCQAVLVKQVEGQVIGENICEVHSSNLPSEQEKLARAHPGEPDIVRCKHRDACYVKGRLMPTRAFGDLGLKHDEFNNPRQLDMTHGFRRSRIQKFTGPYITHKPDIKVRKIEEGDKFIILASDGLWDEMSEQEAAALIYSIDDPKEAAEKLLQSALDIAANKRGMSKVTMGQLPLGIRRSYHDDITIVVVPLK
ncbi:unnamed protein product [Blepharisma stoltei]|uniref:PPM-type phosphatase domain-containing protein n=1 Tax=Blepharisma stoltei TaxID=1481888 RepID=A0AAU9JQJ6_9CILI|nr:unnamed protein product [Blepharisma stoltei]